MSLAEKDKDTNSASQVAGMTLDDRVGKEASRLSREHELERPDQVGSMGV